MARIVSVDANEMNSYEEAQEVVGNKFEDVADELEKGETLEVEVNVENTDPEWLHGFVQGVTDDSGHSISDLTLRFEKQ